MKGILRPRQWYSRVAHLWDSLMTWGERWRRSARKPLFPRRLPGFESLEKRQLLTGGFFFGTPDPTVGEGIGSSPYISLVYNGPPPLGFYAYVDYDSSIEQSDTAEVGDFQSTSVTWTYSYYGGGSPTGITVPIIDDNIDEYDETFTVTLSNPVNGPLRNRAKITYRITCWHADGFHNSIRHDTHCVSGCT